MIFQIVSVKVSLHPKVFILGLYPINPHLKNQIKTPIDMCLLQAKRLIALAWTSVNRLCVAHWLREMYCLTMEKITHTVKG